jgi:hypothetical protein
MGVTLRIKKIPAGRRPALAATPRRLDSATGK